MIISRTPLRISFFGGGTDYPVFYKEEHGGAVLSTTINKYSYVICRRLPPFFDYKPGQFMFVTIKIGKETVQKPFSISTSPTEKAFIEFT